MFWNGFDSGFSGRVKIYHACAIWPFVHSIPLPQSPFWTIKKRAGKSSESGVIILSPTKKPGLSLPRA